MSPDAQFWLGIFLSIPIGIATGIGTPYIQKWLERNSKNRALKEMEQARNELNEVSYYADNREIFTQYLIQVAIRTTFIGSLLAIFSNSISILNQIDRNILSYMTLIPDHLTLFRQLIATIGSLMIIDICRKALSLWQKVSNYEEYKAIIEAKLTPLDSNKDQA